MQGKNKSYASKNKKSLWKELIDNNNNTGKEQ